LFEAQTSLPPPGPSQVVLASGVVHLVGHALADEPRLLGDLAAIEQAAPFRHMVTPGGFRMSVAMTNVGPLGWITDARGYRYATRDPLSDAPWPALPPSFVELATNAAALAGFRGFSPDACLVNRYEPGARMTLHQDKNERDFAAPIVSVSLGLPATFLLGGDERAARPLHVPLVHGDVLVWGGPARLRFHGVLPVPPGEHPRLGPYRYNLTFRKSR
jgi:alkylated DNA repair protein (DNA oxidative demethylase)